MITMAISEQWKIWRSNFSFYFVGGPRCSRAKKTYKEDNAAIVAHYRASGGSMQVAAFCLST